MQPARRSSRLSKLKPAETYPLQGSISASMNSHDIPSGLRSSSRKRLRHRGSAINTSPPLVHVELEVKSLSEDESSDDNSDPPLVAALTPENQTKEQRYEESRSVYQTKAQHYPELLRPPRLPMKAKFISMAAADRFKDLRGRKFITQQCISLTDDNLSDVLRVVTEAGLIHTLTDIDPFQPNVVREFIANLPDTQE
ncbi:hypothetical protein DY000_02033535 [Brassica cretica]|uniref:Uncharacterized protein n=1 Tax=Brassica cretica TaxID=69181 RepID=A0ABQ7DW45_BRACR|nr:hypothetical protein DY000_02033535 [Brassica cretica]